jgi:hypothetical protein
LRSNSITAAEQSRHFNRFNEAIEEQARSGEPVRFTDAPSVTEKPVDSMCRSLFFGYVEPFTPWQNWQINQSTELLALKHLRSSNFYQAFQFPKSDSVIRSVGVISTITAEREARYLEIVAVHLHVILAAIFAFSSRIFALHR